LAAEKENCDSELPKDPLYKIMKTDLESCLTDEKHIQEIVGSNKSINEPNLYNLHWLKTA